MPIKLFNYLISIIIEYKSIKNVRKTFDDTKTKLDMMAILDFLLQLNENSFLHKIIWTTHWMPIMQTDERLESFMCAVLFHLSKNACMYFSR